MEAMKLDNVKIKVLEAMAKLELRNLQEREERMKAPSKPFFPILFPALESHHRKESDDGITKYVCKGPGFLAILKQRYSDFQVHEIDMDGNIIHLTDQSVLKYVESNETEEDDMDILTAEQWKSVERMIKTGDPKVVEIDVTEKSKEVQQKIHKILRAKYQEIISNSGPVDDKTIMKIFKMEGEEQRRRNDQRRLSSVYTRFVLYKENTSTMEALKQIARILKIKPTNIMTAGFKDKRAMTSQLVTLPYIDPVRILNSVQNSTKIAVGNFSFTEKPLQLGHLKGNRFEIALRNLIGKECQIVANLKSLKQIASVSLQSGSFFPLISGPSLLLTFFFRQSVALASANYCAAGQ